MAIPTKPIKFDEYQHLNNRELISNHNHTMEELADAHTQERNALEKRDSKNVQEIDTLHKKCRCLTKL